MVFFKICLISTLIIIFAVKNVTADNSNEKILLNMTKKIEQNIKEIEDFHVVNKGKFTGYFITFAKYSEILGKTHELINFTKQFCPKYKICFLEQIQQRKMAISELNNTQKKINYQLRHS